MAENSLATGICAVQVEAALEIARIPEISPELLETIGIALLHVNDRDGVISINSVFTEIEGYLIKKRLEMIFYALDMAGVITRQKKDHRGHVYDSYLLNQDLLVKMIHDVILIRYALVKVESNRQLNERNDIIATLPDGLHVDSNLRKSINSLAASLHRLITDSERCITIVSPFLELTGFERLETALLEAARRGVSIIIISSRITEANSMNHRVISRLWKAACNERLLGFFKFYNFKIVEGGSGPQLHAKVIISDDNSAYIGSANLTEYGLSQNFEIGLLSTGPHIKLLQEIIMAICQSSQLVALTELRGDAL